MEKKLKSVIEQIAKAWCADDAVMYKINVEDNWKWYGDDFIADTEFILNQFKTLSLNPIKEELSNEAFELLKTPLDRHIDYAYCQGKGDGLFTAINVIDHALRD